LDSSLLKQFRQIFNRKKVKYNQKLFIFLFFLIVSSIFWFLNRLSNDYTSDISYPVRYTNFPKDKVLVRNLPSHLSLKVKAHGYTLLKYKIRKKVPPIIINVNSNSFGTIYRNKSSNFYILTRYMKDKISNQLTSEIQIINVSPDTLFFEFADIISKKVAVIPDLEINFEKQFMLKGKIETKPDSIVIIGPHTILDTINYVKTKYQSLSNINQSIKRNITIENIKNVTYEQKRVLVSIPVEQFTESSLKVYIAVINLPDSLVLKTFPGYLTISYLVGLSDYEKVKPYLFKAVVDYNSIGNNMSNKLKVAIVKFPDYIASLKFYPKNVEYIIEK